MPRLEKKGIKSVLEKIKAFLHRQRWKEVLIFFLFLLLALGFWILQSLNEEYDTVISIPVRYKDIPAEIAFKQTPPEEISVSIRDKGNVLLNYTIGRNFAPLEVSYKKSKNKDGVLVVEQQDIESHIQKVLFNTTVLQNFSPTNIKVHTSKREEKKVPVKFNGSIIPGEGYGLANKISVSPAMMNIYSTRNILDSISEIKTTYIEIKNVKKNVSRNIQLEAIPGVTFEHNTVAISVPIEEFTEKTLSIPVVCTGIPYNYMVRIFPPSIKVNCNVPLSSYNDLTIDDFSIRVRYEDLEQNLTGAYPITLDKKPDWIESYSFVPDKIEFIIEQSIMHD